MVIFFLQHASLAAFPSHQFYRQSLAHGKEEQTKISTLKLWGVGRDKPHVFLDFPTGRETGTGLRCMNEEEANQAVSCQRLTNDS